uniref:Uncharacterized protein n=1 Tax=Candidatus Kentrum sp. DK TaxID=2126562 RepID=A0A450S2F9_9GAMM|nr:MAG: hypothetical protein BECKDK2373B_GA0170837_101140 [Candidatus Kentron sp. DK]
MRILVKWFIWIRLYWKYSTSGVSSRVSNDIRAFGSGGNIDSNTKDWRTPSEEEICKSFERLEGENISHFRGITIGICFILIAIVWLFLRAMDIAPQLLDGYIDIFMGGVGGIGAIILGMVFFFSNEALPLQVTKEEALDASENLRLSGEIGRRPTPWWLKLSITVIVFLEAAIFGSLMISYVGDFTSVQNLIAGSVFGLILAIVLTIMTHQAGKTRYIASHRLDLVKVVAQETEQVIETQRKSLSSGVDTGSDEPPITRSETFRSIRKAFGSTQFDGKPLPFIKAWGIPILTLLLVVSVAVAGYIVRDSIQNNVIDMVKRQQIEEASLKSELGVLESVMVPEKIMEDVKAGQEHQIDRFASNEKNAARAGIIIIVITFLGLQVITTIIGYSDGFSFSENTLTYYPRREADEKYARVLTEATIDKNNRSRIEALHQHVDNILAKYYNIAFSRTGGDGLTMPLHKALELRGALRYETYKEHKTSGA